MNFYPMSLPHNRYQPTWPYEPGGKIVHTDNFILERNYSADQRLQAIHFCANQSLLQKSDGERASCKFFSNSMRKNTTLSLFSNSGIMSIYFYYPSVFSWNESKDGQQSGSTNIVSW